MKPVVFKYRTCTRSHKSKSAGGSRSSRVVWNVANSSDCPWGPRQSRERLSLLPEMLYPQAVWVGESWMNSLKEAQSLPAAISPPAARRRSMAGIHPKQHLAQDLGSRGAFKTSQCAHTHLWTRELFQNVLLKWSRGGVRSQCVWIKTEKIV